MNRIPLVALIVITTACSPSPQEQAILDHEQKILGVKTDLSMEIKELKEVGSVKGADSAALYAEELTRLTESKISSLKYLIESNTKMIEIYKGGPPSFGRESIRKYEAENKAYQKRITFLEAKQYDSTELAAQADLVEKYSVKKDSVLLIKYSCTYTILNPLLNNVKQELSKTYYMDKGNQIILAEKAEAN